MWINKPQNQDGSVLWHEDWRTIEWLNRFTSTCTAQCCLYSTVFCQKILITTLYPSIFSCLPFEDIAGSSAWCLIWLSLIFQKHAPCRGVLCPVLSDGRVFRSAKQTQLYVHVCQIQILIYRIFTWIFNIFAETLGFKLLYNHMLQQSDIILMVIPSK